MRNPGRNASLEINNQDFQVAEKGVEGLDSVFDGNINWGKLENMGNVESH